MDGKLHATADLPRAGKVHHGHAGKQHAGTSGREQFDCLLSQTSATASWAGQPEQIQGGIR